MNCQYFLGAAYRAFTTKKKGPTLYDLCDPLLLGPGTGDAHMRRFYKTALANPVLRPLLSRAGVPQLRSETCFHALRSALISARDEASPDWTGVAKPIASLLDEFQHEHPKSVSISTPERIPPPARMDEIIRACARHLIGAFSKNGFIPAYAAFNLMGDPDFRGRELLTTLEGVNARAFKNATLLFSLARVFLQANPHIAALISPPWHGRAELIWAPVQIRHRSAYYDAFFAESLLDFLASGIATADESEAARHILEQLISFCLQTSAEHVRTPHDGRPFRVITSLVPPPHVRMSRFFWQLKSDLGFGRMVPDCDTTVCSFSAATQFGSQDPILRQPLLDFFAGYQVGNIDGRHRPTVAINDTIDFDGGVVTWLENLAGELPFGNDLDPTLNLDILEVSFRNHERWEIVENPHRLQTLRRIIRFQQRLAETGAFAETRAHIYYLPDLYCAYFGRCYSALRALPRWKQAAVDPDGSFERIRGHVLAFVRDELLAGEINTFDAALALLALAKLDAEPQTFAPALQCIVRSFGEGGRRAPFAAYEWNKMKIPTRIVVGGAEVTSAFVLSALVHARKSLRN